MIDDGKIEQKLYSLGVSQREQMIKGRKRRQLSVTRHHHRFFNYVVGTIRKPDYRDIYVISFAL